MNALNSASSSSSSERSRPSVKASAGQVELVSQLAGRAQRSAAGTSPPSYPYAVCQPFTSVTRNLSSRAIDSDRELSRTSSKRSPSCAIPCSATAVVTSGPSTVSTIAA